MISYKYRDSFSPTTTLYLIGNYLSISYTYEKHLQFTNYTHTQHKIFFSHFYRISVDVNKNISSINREQ